VCVSMLSVILPPTLVVTDVFCGNLARAGHGCRLAGMTGFQSASYVVMFELLPDCEIHCHFDIVYTTQL